MLFPYTVDVPMKRLPIATWVIMAATIAIGFPCWPDFGGYLHGFVQDASGDPPFLILCRGSRFEAPQLVGNLFGHAGIIHLLGNMWILFLYGNAVNAKIGHIPYVVLYFVVGVLESLVWLWLGDGPATLGASGAVMGMIGAFVVLYPRNDVSIFYTFGLIRMGTFAISAYIVIAVYVVLDLVGFLGVKGDGTNHLAHLAGAGFGFAFLAIGAATGIVQADPGEHTMVDIMKGKGTQPRKGWEDQRMRGHAMGSMPTRRVPGEGTGQFSGSTTRKPVSPRVRMPNRSILDGSPIPLAIRPRHQQRRHGDRLRVVACEAGIGKFVAIHGEWRCNSRLNTNARFGDGCRWLSRCCTQRFCAS